ncbi:MAG: ribonuclease HIII, partial [Bacilli bacterium]
KKFFEYLKEVPLVVKEVTFLMKAENKNLSVACASIISRYIFLKEMDKLSQSLDIELPKGAGPQVDKIGKEIITKYGYEKLSTVAKLNFKNTERILKDN